ncbi:NADPH--cytochrome P450 reductase [Fasciola gigantica]|uniref:NADPH--cytochrome P450 reductase n=1 Tax=Fasciola gigantica TaxID=46835 RepID=A0A504YIX8_FASGI|nr:NADPH--cytochrome P450 reductase [Fasciola gigantica]
MHVTAVDVVFVGIGLFLAMLYIYRFFLDKRKQKTACVVSEFEVSRIVEIMHQENLRVIIFYGSQTRTAEQFAIELNCVLYEHGIPCLTLNLSRVNGTVFTELCNIADLVVIFVVSTYGEGDPPDDAQPFVHWLEQNNTELKKLNYTVFGLGNSMYTHYNACGKLIDRSLRKLGARRFYPLGLGDELFGLESSFMDWQTGLIGRLLEHFLLDLETVSSPFFSKRIYKSVPVGRSLLSKTTWYIGEPKVLGSYDKQIPYETGDHVALLPQNPRGLVDRLGALLNIDLDHPISFVANAFPSPRQQPFPCPCTYRTAFTHYVDITGPPRMNLLHIASSFAKDTDESERLLLLGSNTPAGKNLYSQWIIGERRSIVDILEEFKSLMIPADVLLERLARLKPRLYSISSSSKVHPSTIHLVCAVVQEQTPAGRFFHGLVSTTLAGLVVSPHNACGDHNVPRLPIYVRSSRFHLPKSSRIPVIMIAAGTGLAPFRAFIQERSVHAKQTGHVATMTLFFGCRRRSEDYIYAEELEKAHRSGHLKLYIAFSRDAADGSKVYVQDRILEAADDIWQLLEQQHAHIYVCGSAQTMARDVHTCLVNLVQSQGSLAIPAAEEYMNQLRISGRYHLDTWS